MNEFKKQWLGHLMTLIILLTVNFIMYSRSTSQQNSQKTQDELIRLDREKEDKAASQARDKALEVKIDNTEDKLSKAIDKLGDKIDRKSDEQTKQIIDIIKKTK